MCIRDRAYSMITREQIRKLAGYSYSRGVDIWRQGKIRRFQIKTTKKGRQIQADVKGSGRNLYNVRILLDEEEDSVQEAWCDCPAFYSYEGLCKHCTAVLLYYLENPDRVEEEHMSLPEFLKPGSYTHLDVYKRQTVHRHYLPQL